jgi:hypothetical protein
MSKGFKISMLSLRIRFSFDDRIDNCSIRPTRFHLHYPIKNEAKGYHQERLERKENAVRAY